MSHEPTRRHAFISPFTNDINPYNDQQRRLLEAVGYTVHPFRLRTLLRSTDARWLWSADTLVVLNWTEVRAFRNRDGHAELAIKGIVALLAYIAVLLTVRARVVYFIHNHYVHDSHGWQRRISRRIIAVLCRLADIRGVLDPTATDAFNAHFLPHPLIGRAPQTRAAGSTGRACRFLIIGQVRRYKGIERVLEVWPRELPLDILGRADPAYAAELTAIIERRNLADSVTMESRFIPDDELHDRIAAADVLILPHQPDSALVSSAVFEALGRVPVILARSSPFNEWLAARFDAVQTFADDAALAALASRVAAMQERPDTERSYRQAQEEFGFDACAARYADALLAPDRLQATTR